MIEVVELVKQGGVDLQLINKASPGSWFQTVHLVEICEPTFIPRSGWDIQLNSTRPTQTVSTWWITTNHLICRFGAVKMLPDGNLIWSLVGFSKVENICLMVFYFSLSSHLSHLLSVEYSHWKIAEPNLISLLTRDSLHPPCKDDTQDCLRDKAWQKVQYRRHCSPKHR